jgi:hypothetical protein
VKKAFVNGDNIVKIRKRQILVTYLYVHCSSNTHAACFAASLAKPEDFFKNITGQLGLLYHYAVTY